MKILDAPAFAAIFFLSLGIPFAQSTTVTISGTVKGAGHKGIWGIVLLAEGGYNATTDIKGNFALDVPQGWSGQITPLGDGITYSPSYRSYTNVSRNLKSQNFSGKVTVNGCITNSEGSAIAGIKVSLNHSGGSATTGADGCYQANPPLEWSGTITPSSGKAAFDPSSRAAGPVREPLPGQDFGVEDLLLSGNVLDSKKKAIPGAIVLMAKNSSTSPPRRLSTDAAGAFSASIPFGWSGRLVPRQSEFTFKPTEREYQNLKKNTSKQSFSGIGNSGPDNLVLKIVDSRDQPAAGAWVVLHGVDGSVEAQITTGIDGLAVFGRLNRPRGSFTIAREIVYSDGAVARSMESLIDIPLQSSTMVFASEPGAPELPAEPTEIFVDILGKSEGYLEPLARTWFVTDPQLPVYPWQLQSDNSMTLLGLDGDPGWGTADWSSYGFLTDRTVTNGASYSISLDHAPRTIPWTANRGLESVFVEGVRKGLRFILGSQSFGSFGQYSSGSLLAADQFPAEDRVVLGYTSTWFAEDQLAEWSTSTPYSSLPAELAIDLPDLSMDFFEPGITPPAASWGISGDYAHDLVCLTYEYLKHPGDPDGPTVSLRWSAFLDGSGTGSFSFESLELPPTLLDWLNGAAVDNACVMGFDRAAAIDFDELVGISLQRPASADLLQSAFVLRWKFFGEGNRRHGPLFGSLEKPPRPRRPLSSWLR